MADCLSNARARFDNARTGFNESLSNGFYRWGRLVSRRPLVVCFTSLVVMLGLAVGVLTLQEETRSNYLWAPRQSKAYLEWQYTERVFGREGHRLILYATRPDGGNIFDYDVLDELLKAHEFTTDDLEVTVDGKTYDFEDVCKKFPEEDDCASENFLSFWDYNRTTLKNDRDDILDTVSEQHRVVTVRTFAGRPEIKGKDDDEEVKSAQAVVITYDLNDVQGPSYEFERVWNEQIAGSVDPEVVTLTHFSERSFDDEVGRLVSGDIPLFATGMIIIVIYLSFTLGPINSLHRSRVILGALAVFNVLLAVGAGFGLASLLGVPFVSITSLLPLILLGVQVDSVIILVDYLNIEPVELGIEERLGRSLRHSGPAILITSLTAVAAFAVGITTDLPAVSWFCTYAAISFAFAFVVGFTFFLSLIVLDERRLLAGRVSFFPCVRSCYWEAESGTRTGAQDAMEHATPASPTKPQAEKPTEIGTHLSGTGAPKAAGLTQRLIRDYYAPTLTRPPVAAFVVLCFATISALSAGFVQNMELGLPDSDVLPDDSYVQDALRVELTQFDGRLNLASVVLVSQDFSEKDVRKDAEKAVDKIDDLDFVIWDAPSWQSTYDDYLDARGASIKDGNYTHRLEDFLEKDGFTRFQEDVACGGKECRDPVAVRYLITFAQGTGNSIVNLERRDAMEAELRNRGFSQVSDAEREAGTPSGFVFSLDYIFAETDAAIWNLTLTNMGYAVIAIFVLMLVFTPPVIAFWITFCVALIDLDLLGMMVALNIPLQAVSFVNLVMAVGLSVDYCVHISHTFADVRERRLQSKGAEDPSPRECVIEGLSTMGASVIKGGFTTFLGICVIAFSSSVAFRTFFNMLSFTVILGMLHGIVLLPILLAFVTVPGEGVLACCSPKASGAVDNAPSADAGRQQPTSNA